MSEIDTGLEQKYLSTLQDFFNLYAVTLKEYLAEYDFAKILDIKNGIESSKTNTQGQNAKRFFETLGLHQYKGIKPNANKDNFDFISAIDDFSLSRLVDIEEPQMGDYLNLDTKGYSIHQAVLDRVIGIMMGNDVYAGNSKEFNFMSLKSGFPELYDALTWSFINNHLSMSGEMTHISINGDMFTYSEIKNLLDIEGIPSERVSGVDLLRALFLDYGGDEMDINMTPTMSFKMKVGEKIRGVMDPDAVKILDTIETDLGGLPGGSVHGGVTLEKSQITNPLDNLGNNKNLIEVLFKNIFQMTDEQTKLLPTLDIDELKLIADKLNIPLDNMMHIDWDFMQVASADGFLPFLNDPAVSGNASKSKLKSKTLPPLFKLVNDFMGHFKTHNISVESTASKALPHLMNMYQELGAMVIDDYPAFRKNYTGSGTGHSTSAVLILPEYMLNQSVHKKILNPGEKFSIWNENIRQLTKDFKWIDVNGEEKIIRKGEILLDSQFKTLKQMAKRMGIELPESPVSRVRGGNKPGNVPVAKLGYGKSAINARFGSFSAEQLIRTTNMLTRDFNASSVTQAALGYEIKEFTYKDWDKSPGKPSIYTDFFTKLRLALRDIGTEELFLKQIVKTLFNGEFIDGDAQQILAVPIPEEAGFTFIPLGSMSTDDMLNLAYMKQGNKNYTPDIYFGGSIGKVSYTPELVEGFRNILFTEDLLEFFSSNVSKIVSVPPVGLENADGVKPTASTVYSIQDMFNKSPKTFLNLFLEYRNRTGDEVFDILPNAVLTNLERLTNKMYRDSITIDDLPDKDVNGNPINYETLLTDGLGYETIMETLNKQLEDLGLEKLDDDLSAPVRVRQQRLLQNRASARAAGAVNNQTPYSVLIDIINNPDNTITYHDTPHLGRNVDDAADGVDALANFFDLTEYSDYELSVTGLAQGPSHMDGKDINEAKTTIANLVTGNPTVYGNYSFKFLDRFDGTTAIPFLNENAKDVFKKNLLISNRIYSSRGGGLDFLNRLTSPKTKVLFFDVSPVQTTAVFKNKIHMLEFDIGIGEKLPNNKEHINRIYTQVAYEFDEVTKQLKIHHYVDNIPNDQNDFQGSVVRNQGNINNIYAIKDSAIIKSLMDLHGVTDETLVIDGEGFLPLSQGVQTVADGNYDTVTVVPGRIAHTFKLVGTEDPDPDSSMYTKTLSESNAPLLRSRKVGTLWGIFSDFAINETGVERITEEFNFTGDMLSDSDVRLQPVINHPNFYITKIKNENLSTDFINNASTLFEPFGMKQDNISGFKISNVHILFETAEGQNIELVGDLNQDLVLTRVSSYNSDTLDREQVGNVIQETIKKNYPNLEELTDLERNALRNNYLTFPELDTTTGKQVLSSLSGGELGEFKVKKIQFLDSTLNAYGDTETALEINQVFKDLRISFDDSSGTGVHTYNPFVTEIMESNSYMGMNDRDSSLRQNLFQSGVETIEANSFNELFTIYVDNMYGPKSRNLYPLRGRYPAPLRNQDVISNFTNISLEPDIVSGPEYTDGLTRHSPVTSSDIAKAARLSGSAMKTILKPVGGAFKLLEKFDVADKIVMKSIKPVSSAIAKGVSMTGGRAAIAALGGAAAVGTIGAGLATIYAAQELYLLAHGLIKEGDLFSDTQKLMKELRDDNQSDGAWKRFWVSTGKNAWKGLEWQQDHSLSGWVEEKLMSGAGMAYNEIIERRNNNYNYVQEVASFANNNESIFDNVNKYDPQYNENFDNINKHINMSTQTLGTPEHKTNLNTQLNNITKYGVWNNSEDLLYNGNEEFLATVDNYIKIAEAYESIGY